MQPTFEDSRGMFSKPDEELSAALNSALARSLEQRIFAPSVAFRGARPGTVYKTGAQGLGYYRDTPMAERAAASPRTFEQTDAGLPPVLIALLDLLCADVDEAAPRRIRRRLKRIPVRNRGRRVEKIARDGPHAETLAACVASELPGCGRSTHSIRIVGAGHSITWAGLQPTHAFSKT